MADTKLLVDTSIIIDFLRKKDKDKTIFWTLINKYDCCISTITHFELFCGATTLSKRKELEKIMDLLTIIDFNMEISFYASKIFMALRKTNQLIEFRDIFIGATAMSLKSSLATLNRKHFVRIEGLKLFEIKS